MAAGSRLRLSGPCSLVPGPCFYTVLVDVYRRVLVSFLFLIVAFPAGGAERPVLVCFGDSITAGYGLQQDEAYPAALERKLNEAGYHYKVVNEGTSGATTKDAVASVAGVIRLRPQVVIVEYGGNDGLRGLPLDATRHNLDAVLTTLDNAHVKVLLAGITLPPNYGADYIHAFEGVFRFHFPDLGADQPEHNALALRHEAQRLEPARALVVELHEVAVHVQLVEQGIGYEVITAPGHP